jgi:hypothetical protein
MVVSPRGGRIHFVASSPLAGDLKASPILSNAAFTSGKTQLADAMTRAEFWTTVSKSAPNYHLLLGAPNKTAITPTRAT